MLAARSPEFTYANLAIRGRKLDGILGEQLEPALAMQPDLVTIYAGANDIMRPRVNIDGLVEKYAAALGRISATGARLVVFTAFDTGGSAIYAPIRGRFALYNELLRAAVDEHGATLVDFWRMRVFRDWRHWDPDRLHLNAAGHQRIAIAVLDTLGVAHDLAPLALNDIPSAIPPSAGPAGSRLGTYPRRTVGAPAPHRTVERRPGQRTPPRACPHRLECDALAGTISVPV